MIDTLKIVLYKQWLVLVSLNIWIGIALLIDSEWINRDWFWGSFMVMAGVILLSTEVEFIKKINNKSIDE